MLDILMKLIELAQGCYIKAVRTTATEVSDVSGIEAAAGGEGSHLLYDNPSAPNHSRDLQWSKISHGDYTLTSKCVT